MHKRLILFIFLTILVAELMIATLAGAGSDRLDFGSGHASAYKIVWQVPNDIAYGSHPMGQMQTNAWFDQQARKHGLSVKTAF